MKKNYDLKKMKFNHNPYVESTRKLDELPTYKIIWEFKINPEYQGDFEKMYGSGGQWAQLFETRIFF